MEIQEAMSSISDDEFKTMMGNNIFYFHMFLRQMRGHSKTLLA